MWKYAIFIILFSACKTTAPNKGSEPSKNLGEVASELVGGDYTSTSSGDYFLVTSNEKFPGDYNRIFAVLDAKSNEVVYGPEKVKGEVSWHAEGEVLIKEFPEIIEDKNSNEGSSKILNIKSGQKRNSNPKY